MAPLEKGELWPSFISAHADLEMIEESGKVRCKSTGHEMAPSKEAVEVSPSGTRRGILPAHVSGTEGGPGERGGRKDNRMEFREKRASCPLQLSDASPLRPIIDFGRKFVPCGVIRNPAMSQSDMESTIW